VSYALTITNPLSVVADLVISKAGLVDDDFRVDGVLLSGDPNQLNYPLAVGQVLAANVSVGGDILLEVMDNMMAQTGVETACACWRQSVAGIDPSIVALAQSRYATCRACSDALQDAFSCRLIATCCFGRLRSSPSYHCPRHQW
jgi:hypothetical protein